jgi:hypothetical protein
MLRTRHSGVFSTTRARRWQRRFLCSSATSSPRLGLRVAKRALRVEPLASPAAASTCAPLSRASSGQAGRVPAKKSRQYKTLGCALQFGRNRGASRATAHFSAEPCASSKMRDDKATTIGRSAPSRLRRLSPQCETRSQQYRLTGSLRQGIFAMRQRIATWLFPSHTGKSPRSTQQFAAIGTLTNFEVRIMTFGVNAPAAEALSLRGEQLRSAHT